MSFRAKPPQCEGCPAYRWGRSFVEPEGTPTSGFVLVGQGPGETEAHTSRPFHPDAPAGFLLTNRLYHSGLQRTEVLLGNLVQCWLPARVERGVPKGNRDPERAEAQWCWNAHVGPWLHGLQAEGSLKHLIPVGAPAAKFLLGLPWDKGVERYMGTSQLVELPEVGTNDRTDD